MSSKINISKSAFIRGKQCHKSLYLKKHYPELEDKISEAQQAIFDGGTASTSFMRLLDESDSAIIKKTRDDLLKYCGLDTFAMVEILKVLTIQ